MVANGANMNNQALPNYVSPQQLDQIERKAAPRVVAAPQKTTVKSPKPKERGLGPDKFEKAVQQQQNTKAESQTIATRKYSPAEALKQAQAIAVNPIATGNAAIISQPNSKKPEDKKSTEAQDRRVIARMMRKGKVAEAKAFARKEATDAITERDIPRANQWLQIQQQIYTGKVSYPPADLVADGQISSNYGRSLVSDDSLDLLNEIANTPGAGSVADAKLASFLRNKSAAERVAPPELAYTPRTNTAFERATVIASALSMTGSAPWDSKSVTDVTLLRLQG